MGTKAAREAIDESVFPSRWPSKLTVVLDASLWMQVSAAAAEEQTDPSEFGARLLQEKVDASLTRKTLRLVESRLADGKRTHIAVALPLPDDLRSRLEDAADERDTNLPVYVSALLEAGVARRKVRNGI